MIDTARDKRVAIEELVAPAGAEFARTMSASAPYQKDPEARRLLLVITR